MKDLKVMRPGTLTGGQLARFADALENRFPALKPPPGERAPYTCEGEAKEGGYEVMLTLPDGVDAAAVHAFVVEHRTAADPTPPDRQALLKDFKAKRADAEAKKGAPLADWRAAVNDALKAADTLLDALVNGSGGFS